MESAQDPRAIPDEFIIALRRESVRREKRRRALISRTRLESSLAASERKISSAQRVDFSSDYLFRAAVKSRGCALAMDEVAVPFIVSPSTVAL
jgi:hypothetical protein